MWLASDEARLCLRHVFFRRQASASSSFPLNENVSILGLVACFTEQYTFMDPLILFTVGKIECSKFEFILLFLLSVSLFAFFFYTSLNIYLCVIFLIFACFISCLLNFLLSILSCITQSYFVYECSAHRTIALLSDILLLLVRLACMLK